MSSATAPERRIPIFYPLWIYQQKLILFPLPPQFQPLDNNIRNQGKDEKHQEHPDSALPGADDCLV